MKRDILKPAVLIFSVLFVMTIPAQTTDAWSSEMYDQYAYKTFENHESAQKSIDVKDIDYALLNAAIFYESNRQRAAHNLPLFKHSIALEIAAQEHSADMVKRNYFSHDSSVKGKKTVLNRLARVGIENACMAENIGTTWILDMEENRPVYTPKQNGGYFSYNYKGEPLINRTYLSLAKSLVNQWMNSTGHRQNILNPRYLYLGCGAAHFIDAGFHNIDSVKATQNFSSKDAGKNSIN